MKKAQVDVALTIGAIIIPLAALMGSLVFAWAIISPFTDSFRLAATISYDLATVIDIAYSVPDDITINYRVPTQCRLINTTVGGKKNYLTCLAGFMNASSHNIRYFYESQPVQMQQGCRLVPTSIEAGIGIVLGADDIPLEIYPFRIPMPAHANLKDAGISLQSSGGVRFEVDDAIIVSKTRTGLYDTISTNPEDSDFLFKTVEIALRSCIESSSNNEAPAMHAPLHYHLINTSSSELCLLRIHQSPIRITSGLPMYKTYSFEHCFDFNVVTNPNCTFVFDSTIAENDPNANSARYFKIVTKLDCLASNGVTTFCNSLVFPPVPLLYDGSWTPIYRITIERVYV